MNSKEKDLVVQEIEAKLTEAGWHRPDACLYWAAETTRELSRRGLRALIQAGTLMWPRVLPEQDDGVSPTHFSYVWEPNSMTTRNLILAGMLPEMHIWVGLPDSNEIVDLTTKFLPVQCQRLIKYDWPGIKPPDYLWTNAKELPEGVIYEPDIKAIVLALRHLKGV